eukprot:scaffold48534_cov32-Tisochrysis_lutea.AAC.2
MVSRWHGPNVPRRPARASRNMPSAAPRLPRSFMIHPRLVSERRVSGCASPSVSRLPSYASRNSASASSRRPWSLTTHARSLTVIKAVACCEPKLLHDLRPVSASRNRHSASTKLLLSFSTHARADIEPYVSGWSVPKASVVCFSAARHKVSASSSLCCSRNSMIKPLCNFDKYTSASGNFACARRAVATSHSRSWPITSSLSKLSPTFSSAARKIMSRSDGRNASARRTSTCDREDMRRSKSSSSTASNEAACAGDSEMPRCAPVCATDAISHMHHARVRGMGPSHGASTRHVSPILRMASRNVTVHQILGLSMLVC